MRSFEQAHRQSASPKVYVAAAGLGHRPPESPAASPDYRYQLTNPKGASHGADFTSAEPL